MPTGFALMVLCVIAVMKFWLVDWINQLLIFSEFWNTLFIAHWLKNLKDLTRSKSSKLLTKRSGFGIKFGSITNQIAPQNFWETLAYLQVRTCKGLTKYSTGEDAQLKLGLVTIETIFIITRINRYLFRVLYEFNWIESYWNNKHLRTTFYGTQYTKII